MVLPVLVDLPPSTVATPITEGMITLTLILILIQIPKETLVMVEIYSILTGIVTLTTLLGRLEE